MQSLVRRVRFAVLSGIRPGENGLSHSFWRMDEVEMTFFPRCFVVFWALIGMAIVPARAQARHQESPYPGVALSGGGALGLAHIGMLRYFEEHHIPIGSISGTSMGGLVGGLYSTGMDSGQLTKIAENADWNTLLNPSPRFIDQPVVDKQSWNRPYGNLTLQFGKAFSLPAGLNSGEALSLLLSRTTLAYSGVSSFDELPTPFRCVATDLITGNAVVLDHGSLAQALRATMSLPGIFTPVILDGKVLVDGGLVQNVPVEVERETGVKKVIAVAFRSPAVKPSQMKTLTDIARQTVTVTTDQNERRSLALADLVIFVDTTKYSTMDYGKWREIIQAGYDAAAAQSAHLKPFEVSPEEWERYQQARKALMRPAISQGRVVTINALSAQFRKEAEIELHRKLDDRIVQPHTLEDVLTGMAAATAVPVVTYEWEQQTGKPEGYNVTFSQRSGDQTLIRPALQYQLSPGEPARTNLQISTATVFANAYKARLLGTMNLGYDPGAHVEYYRPFGSSQYFIAPALFAGRLHITHYEGRVRISETRDRFGGSIYGGIGTWRFAQLRVGVQAGYDFYGSAIAVDGVPAVSGGFVSPEMRWIFNSQDSGGLPTRGVLTEGSAGYSFRNVSYPYFEHHFNAFRPLNKRFSIFGINNDAASFGRKLDYYEQFTAGGEDKLTAFRYQEFHANSFTTAGAGLTLRGPSVSWLSIHPDLAAWYEAGRFDLGLKGWQTHQSTSTGIFFPTPIGAFGMTLSVDERGKTRLRLVLGGV
jgi:NTE family protein